MTTPKPFANTVAGNHARPPGSLDYYPTPPWATEALMKHLSQTGHYLNWRSCWEPAAGGGHMVDVLTKHFKEVYATDIADPENRGWDIVDFLNHGIDSKIFDWAITNPPFKHTDDFVLGMLDVAYNVAVLCRLQWLESKRRFERLWRDKPPSSVLVFSERVHMMKNRLPVGAEGGSAIAYAWYVWDDDVVGSGDWETSLHWIPPRDRRPEQLF